MKFRNAAAGQPMANYFNNGKVVAFSRGNAAFFAMAKDGQISQIFQTGNKPKKSLQFDTNNLSLQRISCSKGLPAGTYCNIIDDCKTSIRVKSDGKARIHLNNYDEPILAICVGYKVVSTAVDGKSFKKCVFSVVNGIEIISYVIHELIDISSHALGLGF